MCVMWLNLGVMLILKIKRSKCITRKGVVKIWTKASMGSFKMERSKQIKMTHAVRSELYHSKFKLHKGDSKELYKLVSRLTGSIMENKLPDPDSNNVICEELAIFFLNKIVRIRESLSGFESYKCETPGIPFPMSDFKPMDNNSYVRQC